MSLLSRLFVLSVFTLMVQPLKADEYLSALRDDKLAPSHCKNFKIERFARAQEWFVYGIEGAGTRGFDYEYPVTRSDANWLWKAFQNNKTPRNWPQNLAREVQLIRENKDAMGFDFKAEGDVLELLALVDLEDRYPDQHYFHTGGVAYHEAGRGRVIGELDLIVADRRSCEVVAVGESKLGVGSLNHARDQLNRFKSFLRAKIRMTSFFLTLPQF